MPEKHVSFSFKSYLQSEKLRAETTHNESGSNWPILNSNFKNIADSFYGTLPGKYKSLDPELSLCSYLKDNYLDDRGIILLEMGGPCQQLSIDINKFLTIDRSAGVTLSVGLDKAINRGELVIENTPKNHSIILGDMFLPRTRNEIKKWLDGKKVDILIERMAGGLNLIPRDNLVWLYKNLNNWYHLLGDNGVMFVESSPNLSENVERDYINWTKYLHSREGIYNLDVQSCRTGHYLRIKKSKQSPANLPL